MYIQAANPVAKPAEILGAGKMFDFGRITVIYFGYRFSKHKKARYAKNLGGMAPWLRL